MATANIDILIKKIAFTKSLLRDEYPLIDPKTHNFESKKTVFITGAGRGLGRVSASISFATANSGTIIIASRNIEELEETAKQIGILNKSVEIIVLVVDITSQESVEAAFAEVEARGIKIDFLINNAGWMAALQRIEDTNPDEWWMNFEINVKGTYLMTRSYLKHLHGTKGVIGNASTISTVLLPDKYSGFGSSKMAEDRFTEYTAKENPHIYAFAYYPGLVPTASSMKLGAEMQPFVQDTAQLQAGFLVHLMATKPPALNGRWISCNWDLGELLARADEITKRGLLRHSYMGIPGLDWGIGGESN